jgi:hypothetical protein
MSPFSIGDSCPGSSHGGGISFSSELTKAEYAGKPGSSVASIQGFGRRLYVWIDGKQGYDTSNVHGVLDRISRMSHDQGAGCLLELPGGRQNDPQTRPGEMPGRCRVEDDITANSLPDVVQDAI